MPQMVIANRLSDGRVVFFDLAGGWVESIERGSLWESDESSAALQRARQDEARSVVVDPSVIDVEVAGARRQPVEIREAIRAYGPSVQTDRPAAGR